MTPPSRINEWPRWPDARGMIGFGLFALTVMILWMIKEDPILRKDEFFKNIAVLIIGTGFLNGVVSWAYSSTKSSNELAQSNARIAEQAATATIAGQPDPAPQDAAEGAHQAADAALDRADEIDGQVRP